MDGEPRLPVTIVIGRRGKTTLVNHILAHQAGTKIAVMVNEVGDIAIDNDLIVGAGDDMVELANGCIAARSTTTWSMRSFASCGASRGSTT